MTTGARRVGARGPWRLLRELPRKLARRELGTSLRTAIADDPLIAIWWSDLPNWGDVVNPVLVEALAGRAPVQASRLLNVRGHPVYSVIGSVLDRVAVRHLEVWGSGFKTAGATCWVRPQRVHAVRGPGTRECLLAQGIDCPPVYGDPALLFPRLYTPRREPSRHALGIVPHYVDRDHPDVRRLRDAGVHVIDILGGITEVVDEICRCEVIASSSLHGLIAADAYGVPSTWIEMSTGVEGDGFKFRDYFGGVRRPARPPVRLTGRTTPQELMDAAHDASIDADLEALLAACPFRVGARLSAAPPAPPHISGS